MKMNIDTALPLVTQAGRYGFYKSNFQDAWKAHENHAIHMHLYYAQAIFGERKLGIQPGDISVLPAGTMRRYDMAEPAEHYCLKFVEAECVQGMRIELPLLFRPGTLQGHFRSRIIEIIQLYRRSSASKSVDIACRSALQLLLLELSLETCRLSENSAGTARSVIAVEQAARLIETRLSSPFSSAALSKEVGLSPNYLARCFKQRFGMTLHAYRMRCRMENAQQLLVGTNLTVKEIGAQLGFNDAQEYNKACRKYLAMPPTKIRLHGDI